MKSVFYTLIAVFILLMISSSFTCIRSTRSVAIDSLRYFKSDQVILTTHDFKDTEITVKLHDGAYTFSKDASKNYQLFKADKDVKNVYYIMGITPISFDDDFILAAIKYQSFDKVKQSNTSKIFRLTTVPISLKLMNSFSVNLEDYNKIFSN